MEALLKTGVTKDNIQSFIALIEHRVVSVRRCLLLSHGSICFVTALSRVCVLFYS
jgi:hypothetical protein